MTEQTEDERRQAVVSLWMKRPAATRTQRDVLHFYAELRQSSPKLLGESTGSDAYKNLVVDLRDYINR